MSKLERVQCIKCKHVWIPRIEKIKECPHCRTRYWTRNPRYNYTKSAKVELLTCDKCGHVWRPRVVNTRKCPSCKTLLQKWRRDVHNSIDGDSDRMCNIHSEGIE